MTVKSEASSSTMTRQFPRLVVGKTTGAILLATGVDGNALAGTVVGHLPHINANERHQRVGYHSSGWGVSGFIDYNGKVTLENE